MVNHTQDFVAVKKYEILQYSLIPSAQTLHIPFCPVQTRPEICCYMLHGVWHGLGSLSRRSQVSVTYIIQLLRSMASLCLFTIPFLCGVHGVAMFVLVTRQPECGD